MATASRALRLVVSSRPSTTHRSVLLAARRRLLSASTEAGGAGDTAVHSGDAPSDDYPDRPPRFSAAEEATTKGVRGAKHASPPTPGCKERVPPFAPSGGTKLGTHTHQELADPTGGSSFTQKRRASAGAAAREEATPGGDESAARKVREEDREYYRTHKPSPLAEVEFADTRKPITQATDDAAGDADVAPRMVEDTVDDSLARAEAMFREAASRGNPEWPHSRALAEMLARRQQAQADGDATRSRAPWGR
ncbi:hypothetical protein HU200_060644 [Digitaria exilis]|uniref:Uncharacterized protein n=1 Tax=Digitaria exilis TaxID=1010633 RepID=A0A835A638_9POAL|nr:hypothetical protein HU200_060644 [Digitaria exilis]